MFDDVETQAADVIKRAKGRKDNTGQEKVVSLDVLKNGVVQELLLLKLSAKAASEDFSSAIRAKAEDAGLNAAVLRKYVNALAAKKTEEQVKQAEQLVLLFSEKDLA